MKETLSQLCELKGILNLNNERFFPMLCYQSDSLLTELKQRQLLILASIHNPCKHHRHPNVSIPAKHPPLSQRL
jgi:hypothetical protein